MHDATEEQKELLLLLIEAKSLRTDQSLYLRPYAKMPNPKDGMVHGSFGQSLQKTRRFSSSSPNLSQLSNKSPIRQVVVPYNPNHLVVAFDEAGQELRHAAVQSGDTAMLSCFMGDEKKKIHIITAAAVMEKRGNLMGYDGFIAWKKSDDEVEAKKADKVYKSAKAAGFLDQYEGQASTLAENLLIKEEDAEEILNAKHEAFPQYSLWQKEIKKIHRERGYALTPLGARKHIILDGSWKDEHELRSALNSIIQGGAAEQLKLIMAEIWRRGVTDRYDCEFRFPEHDAVVFTCHVDQVVPFCKEVHEIMTQPYGGMAMEWESSIEIGPNYGQVTEFEGFNEEKIQIFLNENFNV
jgi:DNA polymerase-1